MASQSSVPTQASTARQPSSSSPESSTPTMTSEDSDTIFLGNRADAPPKLDSNSTERPPPPSRASTLGIKKCWICICDSTEDDPLSPPTWREPCTCNLTAHEECLLDWVADLENPKNRKREPPPSKILCPQCKSEIKIARPRSYIVDAVRSFDRSLGRLVLPGLGLSLFGTIWTGATLHGVSAVWVVFGDYDAHMILRSAAQHGLGNVAAYGLIPFSLIFSRTKYADFVLPGGTLFLLSTQLRDRFELDMTIWPPLPSTVFACLPAIRSGYNWCYERAFGELNRKWMAEVQPRQAEVQEENEADVANAAEAAADEAAEGGNGIVLELDFAIGGGDEVADGEDLPAGADANNNLNGGGGNGNAGDQNHVHQILGARGDELVEGTSGIGESVLGALAFPWVAAGMGGLLSYAIPAAWMTNANWMNGRPGLLRNRWGRTVVGGMAFVVLKDAVMLYCRWRVAKGFRQRRIMDYDKVKKEYKLNA